MAIDLGKETVTRARVERTWRVEIFCEQGNDPVIRAHREVLQINDDGTTESRREGATTQRLLSQVASEQHGGVTGAQLAGLIADRADYWRQQDLEQMAEVARADAAWRETEAVLAAKV